MKAVYKRQKGFTLIELLVVVLIISVVSGIMLSSLNIQGAKMKSRDAQRIGDIKKIQTALESYYMDYRTYPNSGDIWVIVDGVDASTDVVSDALVVSGNYLDNIPKDPTGTVETGPCSDTAHTYFYISDGSYYRLISIMELERSVDPADACVDLGSCAHDPDACYEANNP